MPQPLKPSALRPGGEIRILSLSSPVAADRFDRGCEELSRLGYKPSFDRGSILARDGFFAGSAPDRLATLKQALSDPAVRGVCFTRGGYGVNYLLDEASVAPGAPKILLGYSDLTSLQIFLWRKFGWVTLYGPMVASGFDKGAPQGYDLDSLTRALTETKQGWSIGLHGESLVPGSGEGTLLGGCLTLVETTLATPWELETRGAILTLEDRGMKPWQVDRALMHLKQAGRLRELAGIVLGDFPECEGPAGSETVKDVARRILAPLGVPIVYGAPIGHTSRPILTLPLGVRARLSTNGSARLDILEPACSP
jgi:muramoyltetrapeptide carboxypeptidase